TSGDAHIRPQRSDELAAVVAVVDEAYGRPIVAELVTQLQERHEGPASVSLVAELHGEIVGHVQLSRCWVDAPDRLVEVLSLSPLSVLPRHQGHGIGGRLVREALQAARQGRWPLVFLEGSRDYYSRFGFEAAHRRGFIRPSPRIPEVAFQVAMLPDWEPWMTGGFVYTDVFWELDCVGLRTSRS
ncbi:MAG TPA: N-acetyltransferase, partial [Acidothermaceae bacterium]